MNAIISQTVHSSRAFIEPDRQQAERYLTLLDESAESFTFQTFDDDETTGKPKKRALAKIINGTLDECWPELCRLSEGGRWSVRYSQ